MRWGGGSMDELQTVIICGGRGGQPFGEVSAGMLAAVNHPDIPDFNHGVVGSSKGTDWEAHGWLLRCELSATVVPARWTTGASKSKRAEGPIRNRRMPAYFPNVRAVLAYPGGDG